MDLAIPVMIVAAIAFVLAVMLSFASKVFAVKEDEMFEALREELPGANCGACGYAGCDDYAHALSDDHIFVDIPTFFQRILWIFPHFSGFRGSFASFSHDFRSYFASF